MDPSRKFVDLLDAGPKDAAQEDSGLRAAYLQMADSFATAIVRLHAAEGQRTQPPNGLSAAGSAIAEAEAERNRSSERLDAILRSRSWRITRPLRTMAGIARQSSRSKRWLGGASTGSMASLLRWPYRATESVASRARAGL